MIARCFPCIFCIALTTVTTVVNADWPQLQGGPTHSGNAPQVELETPLGLTAAIPLTDAILASPVVADNTVYVVDGSGVVFAIDVHSQKIRWQVNTPGGVGNVNNVASPAVVDQYLHVPTTAGYYLVLDRNNGSVVKQLDCGESIYSTPVVGNDRVYFATLGAQVYAIKPDGTQIWKWDFVEQVINFDSDRWSGQDWLANRKGRVTWRDHFVCSRDISLVDNMVVVPAGGRTVFLEGAGELPRLKTIGIIPTFDGSEYPATLGQSADDAGNVYVQWHRRDNAGRVEVLRLIDDQVKTAMVPGTQTSIRHHGLLGFAPVAIRGDQIYRTRPEHGAGLCRHTLGEDQPVALNAAAAISPPIILKNQVIYGGLDGNVYVVPLNAQHDTITLATAFGAPFSAPLAVDQGLIFAGCEDGYLYIFGPNSKAKLPTRKLNLTDIRSELTGPLAAAKFDWYTNYGNFSGTNANNQGLSPPLRMRWARRLAGTVKHLPVCGGGRMYIHTAEGQILALEQDTGRLLWRRHWPDVYLSFTSPLYIDGKLLVPQAGMKRSMMRCLDAASGKLLWEAPFTGSPSWSRQFPPVVHNGIAIYASGTGEYAAQGSERNFIFKGTPVDRNGREVMSWIYTNDNPFFPKDHKPRLWAWDLNSGKVLWEKDFSEYGNGGNDCGICLLDGKLFYSAFFGYSASQKKRRGLPAENNGLTASLDPTTGKVHWVNTDYFVTSKCTLSAKNGRLYIGGNNRAHENTEDRHVWCLDAENGELLWQSDPITSALNVVSIGEQYIFSNALRGQGNLFDRKTGEVSPGIETNYACCRFTLSEPYVLGANMDMIDLSQQGKLVSTGPAIDSRECLGAVVSNGRIFYLSQASGFVVSQTYGKISKQLPAVWERTSSSADADD